MTAPVHESDGDDALLARLRDLTLVDLDVLLAGVARERYAALVHAYAGDLEDALASARARMRELQEIVGGADPLRMLDHPSAARARDGSRDAGARVAERLAARAAASRALARFDDLATLLLPRLLEADRRRASASNP